MLNSELEKIDEIFDVIIRLQAINYMQTLIAGEMEGVSLKDYGYTPKNATNYLLWEQDALLEKLMLKKGEIFAQNKTIKE